MNDGILRAGAAALGASTILFVVFGSAPWSSTPIDELRGASYPPLEENSDSWDDRSEGTPGNDALNALARRIRAEDARVMATGRIATHLVGVERLELVALAEDRFRAYQEESGSGDSPLASFDWIVIDRFERFSQSPEHVEFVMIEAERAGFFVVFDQHGILAYARASRAESSVEL